MFLIFISWLNIAIIVYSAGLFTLSVLKKNSSCIEDEDVVGFIILLIGFATLSIILLLIHFIFPINLITMGIMSIFAIIYLIFKENGRLLQLIKSHHSATIYSKLAIGLFAVILSYKSSQYITMYDEGLYYTQFFKWTQEYSIVPGLGNLYGRLAFNSSWHTLNSLSYLSNKHFCLNESNSFLGISLFVFIISRFENLYRSSKITISSLGFICVLPLSYILMIDPGSWGFITADSADPMSWILVLTCFHLYLSKQTPLIQRIILILSIFSVTVKISTLPIILLNLPMLSKSNYIKVGLIGGFYFLPWIFSNILISGHVIYPIEITRISFLDWAVPSENTSLEALWIASWARLPSTEFNSIQLGGNLDWVPIWWNNLTISTKILIELSLTGWFFTIFYSIRKKLFTKKALFVNIVYLIGISLWFFNAPDVRFGLGFLLFPAIPILQLLEGKLFKPFLVLVLGIAFAILPLLYFQFNFSEFKIRQLAIPMPLPYKYVQSFSQQKMGEVSVYLPIHWDQCWDSPLPCSPYPVYAGKFNTQIQYRRGKDISDGFKSSALSAHRKQ